MAFDIIPKNPKAGVYGMPNGFWPAFCVETPVSEVLGCRYTERGTVYYEHDGYIGEWITEEEALRMYELLKEYVKTTDYLNHRYFSEMYNGKPIRRSQMEGMLKFLPLCKGFKKSD